MSKMNKFGFRMAALMLVLSMLAVSLSSCGFFVDSYLSDYPEAATRQTEKPESEDIAYPDITTSAVLEETESTAAWVETDSPVITDMPATTGAPATEPAPVVTEPETTDNIPDDVQNNVYLSGIDSGRCGKLTGNVTVTVIILNDSVSKWDSGAIAQLKASLDDQEKMLESDAAGYGKQLDITFSYIDATVSGDAAAGDYSTEWADEASKAAGFASLNEMQKTLDNANGADSNPVVYALNKTGRAYAMQQTSLNRSEYLVLFSSKLSAFRHELYHLYGAEDFYYPELVDELALKYLEDSIMNDGETTDALTAFIIGWDDEIDPTAHEFLKETNHLTTSYLKEENEKQSVTGYVTDHKLSYGVYTGYLERGVPTGEGTLVYDDSAVASGTFLGGSLNGKGSYTWPSGDNYTGDFVDGSCTGIGTYTWASGDVYTGDFIDGARTGKGTYTWSDGSVYTGDFVDGKRTGNGTSQWANGNSYAGEYLEGELEGKGVYTFASGSVYEGDFHSSQFHGTGTMIYANGATYTGSWSEGKFHGTGKYKLSDGSVYEGEFVADLYSGKGTMHYASGDSYVGEWSNNLFHGYGTYTWSSGGSYEGNWYNGKQHGEGKQIYSNGSVYAGEFLNGKRHGTGTMNYVGGDSYVGEWSEGNPHGNGTFTYAAGHVYSGAWENGTITGYGKMNWSNGSSYEGYWVNGKRHGNGKYVSQNGKIYNGYWENDTFKG